MPITGLDSLRARLDALQSAGRLDATSLQQTFAEARHNDVQLSTEQVEALYDDLHHAGGRLEAAAFLRAAMPDVAAAAAAPAAKGPSGLAATVLRLQAGTDGRLQADEIEASIADVAAYFVTRGSTPAAAQRQARVLIGGELGLCAGGRAVHPVDAEGNVTALAASFGAPLAVHAANYQSFLADRAVRETRGELMRFVAGEHPALAQRLAAADSLQQMAGLLADAHLLKDAVAQLAQSARPPFNAAFAQLVGEDNAAMQAGLAALDHIQVRFSDTNANGQLDTSDVEAVQLGETAILHTVDPALRDRLQVAQAMQEACRDMTTAKGASKFAFQLFPPHFNHDLFRLDGKCFVLKPGKSASAAIRDIIDHPEKYGFECATSVVLAWHIAEYHLFQQRYGKDADAEFDAEFAGMRLGPWRHGPQFHIQQVKVDPKTDVAMAGDWRYFRTWSVSGMGKVEGWQGENVIYLGRADRDTARYHKGDKLYFGHPFGITTGSKIIAHLNGHHYPVSVRGADAIVGAASALQGHGDPQLAKTLATIGARLQTSRKARRDLKARIDARTPEAIGYSQRLTDAKRHGTEDVAAKKALDAMAAIIAHADAKIDHADAATADMAHGLAAKLETRLRQLRRDPNITPDNGEVAALRQALHALATLQTRPASLSTTGRVLEAPDMAAGAAS